MLLKLLAKRTFIAHGASSKFGTPGGGGGGGAFRIFSRIHLPRMTGEVRFGYDETVRMLAWRQDAASLIAGSSPCETPAPSTPGMP